MSPCALNRLSHTHTLRFCILTSVTSLADVRYDRSSSVLPQALLLSLFITPHVFPFPVNGLFGDERGRTWSRPFRALTQSGCVVNLPQRACTISLSLSRRLVRSFVCWTEWSVSRRRWWRREKSRCFWPQPACVYARRKLWWTRSRCLNI